MKTALIILLVAISSAAWAEEPTYKAVISDDGKTAEITFIQGPIKLTQHELENLGKSLLELRSKMAQGGQKRR